MNYKRNKRYFIRNDVTIALVFTACAAVLAAVGCIVGFGVLKSELGNLLAYASIGVACALTVIPFAVVIVKTLRKPSDLDIDAQYQLIADCAAEAAVSKAGLTGEIRLEIKPVVLCCCVFEDIVTAYRIARGKDKQIRSSNFGSFVLLFTLEQLIVFRGYTSIIRQERSELIEEYYYDDIVNFSTETRVYEDEQSPGGTVTHEELRFTMSSGDTVTLPFENNETARQAIMTIRRILRAKKRFR